MSSHNTNAISPSALPIKLSMGRRTDRPDVESEYAELQRQYRVLETEKKAYTEKTQIQLKKLEAMVDKLKDDNSSLKQEIKNLEQRRASFQQNTISPAVEGLVQGLTRYTERVESESARLVRLDQDYHALHGLVRQGQDKIQGHGRSRQAIQTQGYISTLENRLQTALSKYSDTVATTKKLRNEIESKKREKQVFDGLSKKREKDIVDRKKRMAKIVEDSNYAYEARDDLQNKMISTRDRMVKEAVEHEEQLQELGKLIEQEEAKRSDLEMTIGSLGTNYDRSSSTDPDATRTRAVKSRASTTAETLSVLDEGMPASLDDHIRKFDEFFEQISPLAGDLTEPSDIANKIISDEFHNFSRFNFINETNKEAEKLEAEIKLLKLEVEKCKMAEDTGGDKIRKKLTEGLQQNLEDTEKKTEKFEAKATQCLKVFSIKESFHEILDMLGDYRSQDLSINELNETNIWRFLATISKALQPYLTGYIQGRKNKEGMDSYEVQAAALDLTNALLGLSPSIVEDLLAPSALVQIDPPTSGYDSTDPEDQIYPFSSEEMRMKLTGNWTGLGTREGSTMRTRRERGDRDKERDRGDRERERGHTSGSTRRSSTTRPSTSTSAVSIT